jgi:hypothetical protein
LGASGTYAARLSSDARVRIVACCWFPGFRAFAGSRRRYAAQGAADVLRGRFGPTRQRSMTKVFDGFTFALAAYSLRLSAGGATLTRQDL